MFDGVELRMMIEIIYGGLNEVWLSEEFQIIGVDLRKVETQYI